MCLTIDKIIHSHNINTENISTLCGNPFCEVFPLIAKKDVLVYKVLELPTEEYVFYNEKHAWLTPFRHLPVIFKDGIDKIESNLVVVKKDKTCDTITHFSLNNYIVNIGIHSYTNEREVKCYDPYNRKIFKAVIPKGTPFYVGTNGDIVSKELIIYEYWDSINNSDYLTMADLLFE